MKRLRTLNIAITLFTVVACTTITSSEVYREGMLKGSDLPGWRWSGSNNLDGGPCPQYSSLFVTQSYDAKVSNAVVACSDERKAKNEYVNSVKKLPESVLATFTPISIDTKSRADEIEAWCDIAKYGFVDVRNPSAAGDASCNVIARYGRLVTKMSILFDSKDTPSPNVDDLIKWTLRSDDLFTKLGKP